MKYKVGVLSTKKSPNGLKADMLTLTKTTDDRETVRLFKMLYQKFRAINTVFDPLDLFHNQEP